MSQRKAGVLLSYLSQGIQILSALLYTPVMLRLLGKSEYGLYQLVYSVVSYMSLFSLGFTSSYIRYYSIAKYSGSDREVAKLNGMFMTIFTCIAFICAFCGWGMISNISYIFGSGLNEVEYHRAKILMALMVLNLCISFPNSVFSCIIAAHERFFFQRLLNVLSNLLNPFLTLPLLLMGYGSVGMVLVSTFLTILRFFVDIWYSFTKLKVAFVFGQFNIGLLKDIWTFTFFIFLNQIIDQINWSVDRFLLGRMIGTAAVAVYGLGSQINTMYVQLSTTISGVFSPQINRIVAERDDNHELSELFTRVGRVQFLVLSLVLTGFIFFGKKFMVIWSGDTSYGQSYYVALILIIPVTVPLIQNIGIEIQRAKNMHKARSVVYFFIALANILISIPLVRLYGSIGAAVGTAISLIIGNVLFMNWYYSKKIGLEIRSFWHQIASFLPALVGPGMLGVLMMCFIHNNSVIVFLGEICLYTVAFCYFVWKFGMNDDERQMIRSLCSKLSRRGGSV